MGQTRIILSWSMLLWYGITTVYGAPSHPNGEIQQLNHFIGWQKQLNWNAESQLDDFLDGTISNIVKPLTGQWEVWSGNQGAVVWETHWNESANARRSTRRIPWIDRSDEIPMALFGEQIGASPLYTGVTYRWGLNNGRRVLKSNHILSGQQLRIKVYDLTPPTEPKLQPIYTENIRIPLNQPLVEDSSVKSSFTLQWDEEYLTNHCGMIRVGSFDLSQRFGLENWIQYTESKTAFGRNDGSGIILSHRANGTRYGYVIQLFNEINQSFDSLYALDFSPSPPEVASFLPQPQFMREPQPPIWGVTAIQEEQLRNFGTQPRFMAEKWHQFHWSKYQQPNPTHERLLNQFNIKIDPRETNSTFIITNYRKNAQNTPIEYPELDQLVNKLREPLAIAAYVQNEIELIDGVGVAASNRYPEPQDWARMETLNTQYESDIIVPGKLNRSPLGTFLEKQGGPWEQCALLVYLLRQAGYAAAYAEAEEPLIFLRNDFSRLLRLQLQRPWGRIHADDDTLIRVRYPWVAYYDENQQTWIHIFPWIKETQITEGFDLYGILPDGYRSGLAWIKHYLESDPNILKHIQNDEDDTAAMLFKRFVNEEANKRGINPDNIGVRYRNLKKSYADWESLPKPLTFNGEAHFSPSLEQRSDLFPTIKIEISSLQNPHKLLATGALRLANIHNRAWYLSFNPVSNHPEETNHKMTLRMEGIKNISSNPIKNFEEENLTAPQEKSITLDGSDHQLKLKIIYDPKMEGSFSYPIMRAYGIQEVDYTLDKGSLTSICINIGRITKEMLDYHVTHYNQLDGTNHVNKLGNLAYITGITYFNRTSSADKILRELHKINNSTEFRVGLSKLTPDLTANSPNLNHLGTFIGQPVFRSPQLDMKIFDLNEFANGGIRPDLGEEISSVKRDYYALRLVDGSSQEHQVIRNFYGDKNAVSTIKLLRLAHQRHINSGQTGTGFLIFTRNSLEEANRNPAEANQRYFSHIRGLDLATALNQGKTQWEEINKSLGWNNQTGSIDDNHDSAYSIIYMTPGEITSEDGTYTGVGTLIFTPSLARAMISNNQMFMNGGFGTLLPEDLFDIKNLKLSWDDSGYTINHDHKNSIDPHDYLKTDDPTFSKTKSQNLFEAAEVAYDSGYNDFTDLYEIPQSDFSLTPEVQADYKEMYRTLADPVDIITGAFQIQTEDLSLNGKPPLVFRRNYSSANPIKSELGYGWKHSLTPDLVLVSAEIIKAAENDGTIVVYRKTADNLWTVLPEDNPHLVSSGDENLANQLLRSTIKKEIKNNLEEYDLYSADGSLRSYQVHSYTKGHRVRTRTYLTQWRDASGNKINFEYGDDNRDFNYGHLKKITSDTGNIIELFYNEYEQLVEVNAINCGNVRYTYDKFGDLSSVILPDGNVIQYAYQHNVVDTDCGSINYSTHKITHEHKPQHRILQNIYDDLGRVIEQKTTKNKDSLITNAKFVYNNDVTTNQVSSREVHDALDGTTYYKLYNSLITHIVDPLGNQIYQSWYLDKDRSGKTTYFDAKMQSVAPVPDGFGGLPNQLMSRIDKRGLRVDYSYDNRGRLVQKKISGDNLSGDHKLTSTTTRYSYTAAGKIASITEDQDHGVYFAYNDQRYPDLTTYIERKNGNNVIYTQNYTYGAKENIDGLLLKEHFTDFTTNQSIEMLYDYNSHGLPVKQIHKMGNDAEDQVINFGSFEF